MWSTARTLLVTAFAALALTACSAEISTTKQVSKEDLERSTADALEQRVGQRPEQIECPGAIDAEQGTKARCVLAHQGTSYGVSVTVTSVEGDNVKYDVAVDEKPMK
ncbi:DUF4333 domain-containing protein [Prauserella flavalba]|uniref:DUF4333 domain-containing protein n=1 Tax=Prauserella flavalba TaxID=1477506 RepID=A0A318LI84_9PSEU|nr:DUF4333 domain-containing protein [Prauserella flavalba]PXY20231.1 hypothetical protein BA062_33840 [Prauserella flavalba]